MLLACAGCSAPKKSEKAPPAEPANPIEKPESQVINLGEGSGERFGGKQNRDRLWTVRWKSAVMQVYKEGGEFSGELSTVTGDIFRGNNITSTFSADRSTGDKNSEVLILEGHATVVSKQMKSTLTCDRIRYEAGKKLVKALGNVRIVGPSGTVSGLEEVWTTPDLKVVSTPDMFKNDAR
ncbi:MAG: LPS export ABC transporter periplasmic protein LptC [Fimbriimonas sp.]